MADSCATCKFYKPTDDTTGICRIVHPGVVVSPVVVLDQRSKPTSYVLQAAWPVCNADDWCGEFIAGS